MWDIFIGIFGNIVFDILLLIFLLIGIIVGILWRPGWANRVIKFMPREYRYVEFPIEHEYAMSIECKEVKGFPFLAKEGTAYTWSLRSGKNIQIGKLSDALRTVLGKKFYDLMPEEAKEKLEESKINVTVDLEEGSTPEGFRPISEEEILREEDRKAAETYWAGKKEAERGAILNTIITILAGVGIGFIGAWLLKVGGTTVIEQTPQAAMFMIRYLLGGVLLGGV